MGQKIKILHIFGPFKMGGMEANLLNFLNYADFNRFEHYIFVPQNEGHLKEQYHKLPVRITTLKCSPKRFFYNLPFGYFFCKKHGINIIHGHNYYYYLYGYILSLLTKIPLFTSNYGLGLWKKKRHLFLESVIFRRAKINIVLSNAIMEKGKSLVNWSVNHHRSFKLVYPIIKEISLENLSLLDKKKIKQKLKINNDKPILTIIGRIDILKGHRFAIDAIERINKNNLEVNLLIVGAMHDQTILKENDLNKEYIRYLNYYEQIEEIWRVSNIFLIPSLSEGTPLVLVEYLAIGKPIIASDISGNGDLIKDGYNGYLFKVGDVDDLVKKIKLALMDDNIKNIQANAREFYLNNLLPKKLAQRMESFYSECA